MDPAEAWLREHDPEYKQQAKQWKHITGYGPEGTETPPQEIPWDEETDGGLDWVVERGVGWYMGSVGRLRCESCGELFSPGIKTQKWCSDRCKQREAKRRQRTK